MFALEKNSQETRFKSASQQGINMVDLMMWLVIAALLLAAAIQGIGYYQKAAYLSNMKSDGAALGTNAMAVAANNEGIIDRATVDQAVADTKWSAQVMAAVEQPSDASLSPYVRVSHPGVTDKDVVYLFDSCGDYAVGVNVIPAAGTPDLTSCGIVPGGSTGGAGGGSSAVTFVPLTATNPDNTAATSDMIYYMNKYIESVASPLWFEYVKSGWTDPAETNFYTSSYSANLYNKVNGYKIRNDIFTMINNEEAWNWNTPGFAEAKGAYDAARNAFENKADLSTVTIEEQQNEVNALRAYYAHLLSVPHKAYSLIPLATDPSSFVTTATVTAGSSDPITGTAALPDNLTWTDAGAVRYYINDSTGRSVVGNASVTTSAPMTDANGNRYFTYTITPSANPSYFGQTWEAGKSYYVGIKVYGDYSGFAPDYSTETKVTVK